MRRSELLERVREARGRLVAALEGFGEEEASRVGLNEHWSVKDALSHITAWEVEGARIVGEIQRGTWRPHRLGQEEIDSFNARAVEERRGRSLGELRQEFDAAHGRMERLLESLPEEVDETSPAFQYARGVTFRHHAHHAAQIEEWKKKMHGDG